MATDDFGYPHWLLGVTAACVIIIGLLGTFGNIMIAMALLQNSKLRQRTSTFFMVNLPACLIPVCAIGMPMFAAACVQRITHGSVVLPEWIIVATFVFGLILSQVHIHTITALAFNRFVAVVWPSWYKRLMKPTVVAVYLICLWVYSVLLWLPLAFGSLEYVPQELMVSISDPSKSRSRKGLHVFFTYIFPIFLTSICYSVMYIKVRRTRRLTRVRRASVVAVAENNVIRQWDDHVTKTILVIYAVLITCSVPHLIIHILHLYTKYKECWLLLHVVFWLQFCIDPVVYIVFSRVYRRAAFECLSRLFPRLEFLKVDNEEFPKSGGRSDIRNPNMISSPGCSKHLKPPIQKIEFSSEVHRDLLDPKNILNNT